MHREFSRWGLALVLIVGLLVRVGFVAYEWEEIASKGSLKDPDDYGRLALNLVHTGTFGYPVESIPQESEAEPRSLETAADEAPKYADQSPGKSSTKSGSVMRPTAYRPPLYPAFLALAIIPDLIGGKPLDQVRLNSFVVIGFHILLGLITIGLMYYIAWRLDVRWGWIPALAVAADPILLYWGGQMMTETLITMLAVWAWALYLMLVRPNLGEVGRRLFGMRMSLRISLLLGLVLGLAVLTRPTMLPWAVLMIASLSLRGNDAGNRVSMITAALIVMSLVNAGWMVRNKQLLGKPIWTTTHGGYTLLLANNPSLYEHFETVGPGRNWDAEEFHKLWAMRNSADPKKPEFWEVEVPSEPVKEPNIDELKDDRRAQEVAITTIKSKPETFVKSCVYRAGWLWALFPYVKQEPEANTTDSQAPAGELTDKQTESSASQPAKTDRKISSWSQFAPQNPQQWIIGGWYALWFVMALLGVFWLREALTSRVWLMPVLLVLTLTAIHMIYWSNMRMRAPLMPVVYMLACWPLMRCRTPSRL